MNNHPTIDAAEIAARPMPNPIPSKAEYIAPESIEELLLLEGMSVRQVAMMKHTSEHHVQAIRDVMVADGRIHTGSWVRAFPCDVLAFVLLANGNKLEDFDLSEQGAGKATVFASLPDTCSSIRAFEGATVVSRREPLAFDRMVDVARNLALLLHESHVEVRRLSEAKPAAHEVFLGSLTWKPAPFAGAEVATLPSGEKLYRTTDDPAHLASLRCTTPEEWATCPKPENRPAS